MNDRDKFAAAALTGLLASGWVDHVAVEKAYAMADRMLALSDPGAFEALRDLVAATEDALCVTEICDAEAYRAKWLCVKPALNAAEAVLARYECVSPAATFTRRT